MWRLAVVFACGIAGPVYAETEILACQYTRSGGYIFDEGRWKLTNFQLGVPFFLKLVDDRLDPESFQKVFEAGNKEKILCSSASFAPYQTCAYWTGDSLFLNTTTLRGSVSTLFGAGMEEEESPDTLHIKMFVCQKM